MENHVIHVTTTAEQPSNEDRLLELANIISVPISLNTAVRLNVPDAIWQGGSNTPLSASAILARVLPDGGGDAAKLQGILRMLTSYGVFAEHLVNADEDGGSQERKFSLTDIGKTLVTDQNGLSYGPYILQHHQDVLMVAGLMVHEAVDSTVAPFGKKPDMYGLMQIVTCGLLVPFMSEFTIAWLMGDEAVEPTVEARFVDYWKNKPEMNGLMQIARSGLLVPFLRAFEEAILDNGFGGAGRLGGSAGDCLRMIPQKHSSVREGINFDMPDVVAKAPTIAGVSHVGGDMFKSIPSGAPIFMELAKAIQEKNPIPVAAAVNPNDPRIRELEDMERQKSEIDRKAKSLVWRELWCGLGYLVVQTAAFMRLTFWELSWDVMEPICFYVTSMYLMARYAFFLRTSIEPSFEGFFQSRFHAKQKRLMKLQNFDEGRYNELRKACYSDLSSSSSMLMHNP